MNLHGLLVLHGSVPALGVDLESDLDLERLQHQTLNILVLQTVSEEHEELSRVLLLAEVQR